MQHATVTSCSSGGPGHSSGCKVLDSCRWHAVTQMTTAAALAWLTAEATDAVPWPEHSAGPASVGPVHRSRCARTAGGRAVRQADRRQAGRQHECWLCLHVQYNREASGTAASAMGGAELSRRDVRVCRLHASSCHNHQHDCGLVMRLASERQVRWLDSAAIGRWLAGIATCRVWQVRRLMRRIEGV
jgi:hypothetical protein